MIINDLSAAAQNIPWAMAGATRRETVCCWCHVELVCLYWNHRLPLSERYQEKKNVYLIIIVLCVCVCGGGKDSRKSKVSVWATLAGLSGSSSSRLEMLYFFLFYLFVMMSDLLGNPTTFRRVERERGGFGVVDQWLETWWTDLISRWAFRRRSTAGPLLGESDLVGKKKSWGGEGDCMGGGPL